MVEALVLGAVAASSLVLGALLAFARPWRGPSLGLILAFGAGALISAVSFELFEEGVQTGGAGWTGLGLGIGAITYYLLDGVIARRFSGGRGRSGRAQASGAGPALALGAFLDGIPEQLVLGIGLATGEGVGVGLLAAIFVSNLPEAIGSASEMRRSGTAQNKIMQLWLAIAAVCVLACVAGYAAADAASNELTAVIDGFAAGALLVMMIDSMIPEARSVGGRAAGLLTVLGFAVAAALSSIST
jgi:zinc transporter, ZIP family